MEAISNEIFEQAVALLGNPDLSQEQAADELVAHGTNDLVASRLVTFIPEAFGIFLARQMEEEPSLPHSFGVRDKSGKSKLVPFDSEPIFVLAMHHAQTMYHQGTGDVLAAISLRGSIMKSINNAVESGLKLNTLQMVIAFGIPAEVYRPVTGS